MSDNIVAIDACTEAELALQSYLDGVITRSSGSGSRPTSPSASMAVRLPVRGEFRGRVKQCCSDPGEEERCREELRERLERCRQEG